MTHHSTATCYLFSVNFAYVQYVTVLLRLITHKKSNNTFQYLFFHYQLKKNVKKIFTDNDFVLLFSGGATFTIQGEGFNNVGQIAVERVVSLF